ncbi:HNH endonuclease [Streptomyces sp. BHT-5-2]|uniref:HNH endonuclease n=1 Tax=Streptomyces sp. BHT-5-2 TaxID=2866715 RepID=UPI001C8DFBFE|nr:HNH endonuclease signature motif containing protein [Streptomyces sp. BHT-5-2]QZL03152.1 HNH endonuclease [Streptomyces sp. BHT-5-2]
MAAKKQRTERPKGDSPKAPRPKPTLTPGTPPVPDPTRTRKIPGDPYWNPILAAAERAIGGEPCRVCGEPVPGKGHWEHRDRHVCSSRCNDTLKRRTKTRIRRGEIDLLAIPELADRSAAMSEQRAQLSQERMPQVFRTREADADFPYEFRGLGPIPGDIVERNGSVTAYATAAALAADHIVALVRNHSDGDEEPMIALHEQSGSYLAYTSGVVWWVGAAEQLERLHLGQRFQGIDGRSWIWQNEAIRDLDSAGREYTWEAYICLTETTTPILWTPAYAARSAKQLRIRRARNSYQARMRERGVLNAAADGVDPYEIYERDQWICQLCHQAIDSVVEWPDLRSATLDHIKPVTLGGAHTAENLQAAHWVCNDRKGDAWGPGVQQDSAAGSGAHNTLSGEGS